MTVVPPTVDVVPAAAPRATGAAAPGFDLAAPSSRAAPATLEAAEAAFKALVSSTSLEISSFHDDATGRYVVRVADRLSGRVLIQTPPDDLLRFLASAPSFDPPPTLIDV